MRDWVQVNSGNPYLQEVSGGYHINAEVNMLEVEMETQDFSWVVEFKMNGLVRKSSSQ